MTALLNLPLASVLVAVRQSNTPGKIIVGVLFLGSILAWSLMVAKFKELSLARKTSRRFLSAYRKEGHPVALFLKRQTYDASPCYLIYERTCNALGAALEARGADTEDLFMGGVGTPGAGLAKVQVSSVRNVAERTMADQALLLENNMGLLATAASTAPFLGLLGTVWGVMDAFGGMAAEKTVMLSAVAPGISGALLTTVVGLLVALPSAVGYNVLSDNIRRFSVEMDNFLEEFVSDVECKYLEES